MAKAREPLTYSALVAHLQSTATTLRRAGVGPGDRVAVALANGPEMASAFLAISTAASCAPLNPAYRDSEFDFYLGDLRAKAIVLEEGQDSAARGVAKRLKVPILELVARAQWPAGVFQLACAGPAATAGPEARVADFSRSDDEALVLHTSGTTSRPKIVPLTHANICTSAHNICRTLGLSETDRCLNVMPLFHIHGLIGALLSSVAAGGSVVCTPGFDPTQFFPWLDQFQPTWYSAVPTIHQAVIAQASQAQSRAPGRSLRLVRSSSAALPPIVIEQLERTFGVPVIESYGMTEAAHQMASNPLPPGRRKPGSVGLPAGPAMAVMDAGGQLLAHGETGEIVIRGDNVTRGYDSNPAANESAFSGGWFRTGDQGRTDEEGYFFVTGRLKELINRGGEKISPREIDEALMLHPAVANAIAFAVPHPRLGEDVAAAIELAGGASVSEPELREFVFLRLADFKVPSRIVFVDEIPKGPTGKPQRVGLHAKLQGLLVSDFVAPETTAETTVAAMWQALLDVKRVGLHDNFFGLGGDSLVAARLIARINEHFDLELAVGTVFRDPTVAAQASLIEAALIDQIERDSSPGNGRSLR